MWGRRMIRIITVSLFFLSPDFRAFYFSHFNCMILKRRCVYEMDLAGWLARLTRREMYLK